MDQGTLQPRARRPRPKGVATVRDQAHQGRRVRLPPDPFQIQRVKLHRYS